MMKDESKLFTRFRMLTEIENQRRAWDWPVQYTTEEGGEWHEVQEDSFNIMPPAPDVFAVKFLSGKIFDRSVGWRPFPEFLKKEWPPRTADQKPIEQNPKPWEWDKLRKENDEAKRAVPRSQKEDEWAAGNFPPIPPIPPPANTKPQSKEEEDKMRFGDYLVMSEDFYNDPTPKTNKEISDDIRQEVAQKGSAVITGGVSLNDTPKEPWKYNEGALVDEFRAYLSNTYKGYYVGEDNVQSLDLIFAAKAGWGFCQGNVLKYAGPRLGVKGGDTAIRSDILKVLHYALLMLYLLDKKKGKND